MIGLRNPRLLRSLQFFDAVARHGSINGAATELAVSPSAVSHQLRDLTRMMGEALTERRGRGIILTDAGESLATRLGAVFNDLDSAVLTVVGKRRASLRVAVCTAFGPSWLVPRLGRFRAMHPAVDVELRLYAEDPELSHSVADCIISARPGKLGFGSIELFQERFVAVASSGVKPGSVLPLITTESDSDLYAEDWKIVMDLSKEEIDVTAGWVRCTHYTLALSLAVEGLGVALIPDFLARDALDAGKLRPHLPGSWPSGRTYRLFTKEARSAEPGIRAFSAWLKREASAGLGP